MNDLEMRGENLDESTRCICGHEKLIDNFQPKGGCSQKIYPMDWNNTLNLWGILLLPWICNGSLVFRGRTRRKSTLGTNGLVVFGRYGDMFLAGNPFHCFDYKKTTEEGALSG